MRFLRFKASRSFPAEMRDPRLSSPRRRGPITTKRCCYHWLAIIAWVRCVGPRLRGDDTECVAGSIRQSEFHPVGALEAQHLPRFRWRRHLVTERLDNAADLGHLLGIARRELAG